jgi:hypothetical protein
VTLVADATERRVFAMTPDGTRALIDTRTIRERLWSGVRLRPARG